MMMGIVQGEGGIRNQWNYRYCKNELYYEASTSTETKMDSAAKQVQQSVDCAAQVGENFPLSVALNIWN